MIEYIRRQNREHEQERVAVVTGSSSGLGYTTSLMLAGNGFYTYATMRSLEKFMSMKPMANNDDVLPLQAIMLDVTNELSVKTAIERILSEKGGIDILVNNAGYGLIGSLEDISIEELKAQFETNLFGAIRVMQQVLPIMRKQKSGRIINISSIGGLLGYPFSAAYCSTKFALEGLSESLSYEVEPFGIRLILIEPALLKNTNFHNNVKIGDKSDKSDSPYSRLMQRLFEAYQHVVAEYQISVEEVARVIVSAAVSDNPDPRYFVGKYSKMMFEIKKTMPDSECHNIMKKQFLSKE
jgi:NAD(P)-dependent dehydrogenase (short-subunit alcohol dehydrogenase family)